MLNEESLTEGRVCEPKVWDGFDWYWFHSVPTWYFPLWSKLDLYRTTSALRHCPVSSLSESDMLNANVIWDAKTSKLSGYGGQEVDSALELDDERKIVFGGRRHSFMFSDNKSYIVGVTTWTSDLQQSWVLWTTGRELTPEIKATALEHVKQLGFDPKFAIQS
ncbi:hypothetical protein Fcan01_11678 [Folsomia candida]|uniref:Apolipoprotein D n=1 Tax=Folsomia candida TaxID=158441 RepID=A0A226EAS9_FOLCA|nr:hypothetical protein Fcan01_11678 [Folsomia candida]